MKATDAVILAVSAFGLLVGLITHHFATACWAGVAFTSRLEIIALRWEASR